MENIRQKIVEIITHTHKTPFEQADEILLLFSVVGRSEQLKAFVTEVSKGFDDSHKHKVVKKANDILKSL